MLNFLEKKRRSPASASAAAPTPAPPALAASASPKTGAAKAKPAPARLLPKRNQLPFVAPPVAAAPTPAAAPTTASSKTASARSTRPKGKSKSSASAAPANRALWSHLDLTWHAHPTVIKTLVTRAGSHLRSLKFSAKGFRDAAITALGIAGVRNPLNDVTLNSILVASWCNSARLATFLGSIQLSHLAIPTTPAINDQVIDHLDLTSIGAVTDAGLMTVTERAESLVKLRLAFTGVSESAVRQAAILLPHLKELDLSGCPRITPAGLGVLRQSGAARGLAVVYRGRPSGSQVRTLNGLF
ncbi:Lysine-specific demethylase 2A [Blastocladiella emersonii ATCC 22665]|nr:Lysine-specific demethylase 2A [Blastocladiella emersonii ATCC 22665]